MILLIKHNAPKFTFLYNKTKPGMHPLLPGCSKKLQKNPKTITNFCEVLLQSFVIVFGCLAVWLSGCLAVWLSDCLAVWLSDCLAVWLSGCLSVCLSGCLSVWLSGCLAVWLSGCMAVWLSGCLAVWLSVWLSYWLAGWLGGCLSVCENGENEICLFSLISEVFLKLNSKFLSFS